MTEYRKSLLKYSVCFKYECRSYSKWTVKIFWFFFNPNKNSLQLILLLPKFFSTWSSLWLRHLTWSWKIFLCWHSQCPLFSAILSQHFLRAAILKFSFAKTLFWRLNVNVYDNRSSTNFLVKNSDLGCFYEILRHLFFWTDPSIFNIFLSLGIFSVYTVIGMRHAFTQIFEALCCEPEGRRFDSV